MRLVRQFQKLMKTGSLSNSDHLAQEQKYLIGSQLSYKLIWFIVATHNRIRVVDWPLLCPFRAIRDEMPQ